MTREEAINICKREIYCFSQYVCPEKVCPWFSNCRHDTSGIADELKEALNMAIEALQQPPDDNWESYSSRLWKSAYDRGKADAMAEQEPCEDCVSRKDVLDILKTLRNRNISVYEYEKYILGMQSVNLCQTTKNDIKEGFTE